MNHEDNRLTSRNYRKAIEAVETQFALIRFGLGNLSKAKIRTFFCDRKKAEQERIILGFRVLKDFASKSGLPPLNEIPEFHKKATRGKYRKGEDPLHLEVSEDRLNQSELLLLVAHFESFMRQVHRRFLEQTAAKVFIARRSEVSFCKLFSGNFPDTFLREEIEKEIKSVDKRAIKARAEYFKEHFDISFGSPTEIKLLQQIMETRNKISHEIYSAPPRKLDDVMEQPLVSDGLLAKARSMFLGIPEKCVKAGAKKYPSHFQA